MPSNREIVEIVRDINRGRFWHARLIKDARIDELLRID
jgi:hypothetical protein